MISNLSVKLLSRFITVLLFLSPLSWAIRMSSVRAGDFQCFLRSLAFLPGFPRDDMPGVAGFLSSSFVIPDRSVFLGSSGASS